MYLTFFVSIFTKRTLGENINGPYHYIIWFLNFFTWLHTLLVFAVHKLNFCDVCKLCRISLRVERAIRGFSGSVPKTVPTAQKAEDATTVKGTQVTTLNMVSICMILPLFVALSAAGACNDAVYIFLGIK